MRKSETTIRKNKNIMHKSLELIKQELDKKSVEYTILDNEGIDCIEVGFNIKSGPKISIKFLSSGEENDVGIRLFGFVSNIDEMKLGPILILINSCNRRYRFLKFVLVEDIKAVDIAYDFPERASDDTIGAEVLEICAGVMRVVDKEYPAFMKILWG